MAKPNTAPGTRIPSQGSDEHALELFFQELFVAYEPNLVRLATGLCKDRQIARDIVHDVFVKLWELRHQIHEIRSIEAFLFTATRNKVMDHLRRIAVEARLREEIWVAMQEMVGEDTHTTLEDREYKAELDRAVEQLPKQRKAIFRMRAGGYNYEEISEELNISKHTVKNQVSASLKAIRKALRQFLSILA